MDRTDLTGFSALLGESLTSRVDLLERLLRSSHYPSLGQYKERLLAQTVRGFLPGSVEVGTGFVLFPHADDEPAADPGLYDPLNQSAYSISRQCDILIFDLAQFPPIFRDGDFVIVRPEAVRAVIEVKGSLSIQEARNALESFHDFALKWQRTQSFYAEHGQATTPKPGLFLMAWRFKQSRLGRPVTNPARIRRLVAEFYSSHVARTDVYRYPFLNQLFVHNECEISQVHSLDEEEGRTVQHFGWHSRDGRFVRSKNGVYERDKDRTIASLLASLHWEVGRKNFNRFFSHVDEVQHREVIPYDYSGFDFAYRYLQIEEARLFARQH